VDQPTCSVDACGKPVKRLGLCYGHYMKNWRYGTATPAFGWTQGEKHEKATATRRVLPDLTGLRFGLLVVIRRARGGWLCQCDCGADKVQATGLLNRGRETITCGDRAVHHRTDTADYGAAHDRIHRDRGPSRDHVCVGCGAQAAHWSYNHDDPDERSSASTRRPGVAYSLDPDHYSPRCVPCHKRFDLDRLNAERVA